MSIDVTPAKKITRENCTATDVRAIKDVMEIFSGKWKLPILLALSYGVKRFRQIARDVPDITDRMLSKELKDLEANLLIERKVIDSFPPTVEYSITEHCKTLQHVMSEVAGWGILHRKKISEK
jgi:DNA-binding HxlR family transcriptional regulator